MTHKDIHQDHGDAFSEILDVDRVLDEIGRGSTPDDADDQLLSVLAQARAEADSAMPAAPQLAELLGEEYGVDDHTEDAPVDADDNVDELSQRRGKHKFGRRVATATATIGGVSISGIMLAGAAAATIAVGGLGYAAYNNFSQPKEKDAANVSTEAPSESSTSQPASSRSTSSTKQTEPETHPQEPTAAYVPEPQVPTHVPETVVPQAPQSTIAESVLPQTPIYTQYPEQYPSTVQTEPNFDDLAEPTTTDGVVSTTQPEPETEEFTLPEEYNDLWMPNPGTW